MKEYIPTSSSPEAFKVDCIRISGIDHVFDDKGCCRYCQAQMIHPKQDGYGCCISAPHENPCNINVRSNDGNPTQFIAEINGREVGRMSITFMPLVHDMEIPTSPIQRKIVDALFFYASGKMKAAGASEVAVFVADNNEKMQKYVESRGAVKEVKSTVYMMAVS